MAYQVVIEDGPAQGWSYLALVPPEPMIAVAPTPREDENSPRRWTRVLLDGPPWPNQSAYERGSLPDPITALAFMDENGDFRVPYHLVKA